MSILSPGPKILLRREVDHNAVIGKLTKPSPTALHKAAAEEISSLDEAEIAITSLVLKMKDTNTLFWWPLFSAVLRRASQLAHSKPHTAKLSKEERASQLHYSLLAQIAELGKNDVVLQSALLRYWLDEDLS